MQFSSVAQAFFPPLNSSSAILEQITGLKQVWTMFYETTHSERAPITIYTHIPCYFIIFNNSLVSNDCKYLTSNSNEAKLHAFKPYF